MAWLSRILVPIDFSPRCQGAREYAEALARHFQSELTLLHVVSPPLGLFSSPEAATYSTAVELSVEQMEQSKSELANYVEDDEFDVAREVTNGDPARQIVDCAKERDASLIVMATHGYGPFRRFLLGSVTAKVLHDAECPVWTGPHLEAAPDRGQIGFRRIVCAIDLAKRSRDVLAWAGRFAHEFGAELAVVHVLPHSLVELGGIYFDAAWRQAAVAAARERVCQLMRETATSGEVLIEIGDTPATVSAVAASRNADLLVIGRGKESGVMGRLRANAYAILRESPCPVATI